MNPQGPVAKPDNRDTRIQELEGLLAATREDLAMTRGLLLGVQGAMNDAESALGLANENLERRTAELANVNHVLQVTRASWSNAVEKLSGAHRTLQYIRALTDASSAFRNAGVNLGSEAYHDILAAIGEHAKRGMSDDEQELGKSAEALDSKLSQMYADAALTRTQLLAVIRAMLDIAGKCGSTTEPAEET